MDFLLSFISSIQSRFPDTRTDQVIESVQRLLHTTKPFVGNHPVSLKKSDLVSFSSLAV